MKKKELVLLVCSIISIVLLTFTLCIYLPLRAAKIAPQNERENDVWMQSGADEKVLRPLLADLGKRYGDFAKSNGLKSFKAFGKHSREEPYFTNGYYFGTSWRQFQRHTLVYYVYASPSKEAIQKGGWMDAIAGQRHEVVVEKP